MKVKVSDSLDNVPNEMKMKMLSQLGTDRQTNQLTDQLLVLLEWLFATKKGGFAFQARFEGFSGLKKAVFISM